jgi:hypothetical protein
MRTDLDLAIPSPAEMEKMGNRFLKAVDAFDEDHHVPVIHFEKGDRHIDVMTPYLEAATGPAVAAIGVTKEFQLVSRPRARTTTPDRRRLPFDLPARTRRWRPAARTSRSTPRTRCYTSARVSVAAPAARSPIRSTRPPPLRRGPGIPR